MPVLQRISLTWLGSSPHSVAALHYPKASITRQGEPYTLMDQALLSVLADEYQPESEQATTAVCLQELVDALAQRLALVESAEYTIDIQYYIWNSDESGKYLASRLPATLIVALRFAWCWMTSTLNERRATKVGTRRSPECWDSNLQPNTNAPFQ